MYRLLKPIYDRAPIPVRHKLVLKDYIYKKFGPFFARSFGHQAWLKAQERPEPLPKAPRAPVPSEADWREIAELRASGAARSQEVPAPFVVVPVYGGHDETLACL